MRTELITKAFKFFLKLTFGHKCTRLFYFLTLQNTAQVKRSTGMLFITDFITDKLQITRNELETIQKYTRNNN